MSSNYLLNNRHASHVWCMAVIQASSTGWWFRQHRFITEYVSVFQQANVFAFPHWHNALYTGLGNANLSNRPSDGRAIMSHRKVPRVKQRNIWVAHRWAHNKDRVTHKTGEKTFQRKTIIHKRELQTGGNINRNFSIKFSIVVQYFLLHRYTEAVAANKIMPNYVLI